jgi:hypothetical protein
MLSLDTAYRSFGGEVEARTPPRYAAFPDSRPHQLSAIALVSANPTVNRREDRILRERLAAIDAKVNVLVKEAAKLAPPTPPQSPEVTALAQAMADPDFHLPTSAIVSLDWDEKEELIATGLTIEGRFWSIEDIVALGLINDRGACCGRVGRQSIWPYRQSTTTTSGPTMPPLRLVGRASNQYSREGSPTPLSVHSRRSCAN